MALALLHIVCADPLVAGVGALHTFNTNLPLSTDNALNAPEATPKPAIVKAPGAPVTPVAEPPTSINVYVPTPNTAVVVTVTGPPLISSAPAEAPVTVRGAVAPPS